MLSSSSISRNNRRKPQFLMANISSLLSTVSSSSSSSQTTSNIDDDAAIVVIYSAQVQKTNKEQKVMSTSTSYCHNITTRTLCNILLLVTLPIAAQNAVTTTMAATAQTARYFPNETRDFYVKSYRNDDLAPDDAFCYKLATTCPFLTSRTARPTSSTHVMVRVRVDFRPTHFVGIDDLHHQFSVVGTFIFNWQLPRCARWMWLPEQYHSYLANNNRTTTSPSSSAYNGTKLNNNGTFVTNSSLLFSPPPLMYNKYVSECRYRKSEMWHPQIRHLNAISRPDVFEANGRDVIVTGNGRAHWEASMRLDSACTLSFKTFPFDTQRCSIILGAYNYHDFIFQDEVIDEERSEEMFDTLLKNSIWRLDDLTTNIDAYNFSITFDVSRISDAYAGTIFIPTTLLSLLQMSTVLMPPETTDRSAFSITGFVALAVFQSLYTSTIPRTSEMLYITIYYELQMAIGVMITIYSLLICRLLGRYKNLGKPCVGICKNSIQFRLVDVIDMALFLFSLVIFVVANFSFYHCGNNLC